MPSARAAPALGGGPMLRRLRRRLIRQLAQEAFWLGWEEGKVEAIARLAARVEGRA